MSNFTSMTAVTASIAAMAAAISPSPASPILPVARPNQYAAYGPLQLCSNKFVINVGLGEAVHVVGDIARVINDREILAIKFANDRFWYHDEDEYATSTDAAAFSVERFTGSTPDAGNTLANAFHGLEAENIRYALLRHDNIEPMIVGATSFDGSSNDKRLLDRIRPATESTEDCVPMQIATSGMTEGDAGKRVKSNWSNWAEIYPERPEDGPAFHCMSGIGFALTEGEKLLRPWRPLEAESPVYVDSGGARIKIEGTGRYMKRIDPNDPNEQPWRLCQEMDRSPRRRGAEGRGLRYCWTANQQPNNVKCVVQAL